MNHYDVTAATRCDERNAAVRARGGGSAAGGAGWQQLQAEVWE